MDTIILNEGFHIISEAESKLYLEENPSLSIRSPTKINVFNISDKDIFIHILNPNHIINNLFYSTEDKTVICVPKMSAAKFFFNADIISQKYIWSVKIH